jgi:hypothetical protein
MRSESFIFFCGPASQPFTAATDVRGWHSRDGKYVPKFQVSNYIAELKIIGAL